MQAEQTNSNRLARSETSHSNFDLVLPNFGTQSTEIFVDYQRLKVKNGCL